MSDNLDLNRYLTAEPKYEIENNKYSTYAQSCYDKMMESKYEDEAEKTSENIRYSFEENISQTETKISGYKSLLSSFKHLSDLYRKYKKENSDLFKQLKTGTHDILTNERKTYYEDQEIDVLNTYYMYILWVIYIIVVICFVIFSLIYPSQSSLIIRILLLGVFILLPFVSTWILGKLIQLVYWLFGFIPKNVYK